MIWTIGDRKGHTVFESYELRFPRKGEASLEKLGPEIQDISDNKTVKSKYHAVTPKLTPFVTYLIIIINFLITRRKIIFKAN